jgi:DNA modification methylase
MENIKLEFLAPGEVKPRVRAFRKHSPKQVGLIARSLKERGCIEPVLVDSQNRVVCGEAVVAAAVQIGLNRLPVVRADHLSDDQLRAYAVAANRLAEYAGYDEELLGQEICDIADLLADYDLAGLGFEAAEIDKYLGVTSLERDTEAEAVPQLMPDVPVSAKGDLWIMGDHRLLNDDALVPANYSRLLEGQLAQLVLSDVPYNLSGKTISGNGKVKHGDFVQAAGEMSRAEFTRFLTQAMRCMRDASIDGSMHMVFMSWHHLLEMLRAGTIVYDELKALCTWIKQQGGQGALYRSQTEFIGVFKKGKEKHINNIMLGRFGRNRTNAWHYAGMNTAAKGRDELLAMHPTVKPLGLLEDAILDCSHQGGIVLDPFVGSGSTIIAAHRTGRAGYGMELDPLFVDVALRRVRAATGIEPIRASDGKSFSELEAACLAAGEEK